LQLHRHQCVIYTVFIQGHLEDHPVDMRTTYPGILTMACRGNNFQSILKAS